jgi:hypothetical protein
MTRFAGIDSSPRKRRLGNPAKSKIEGGAAAELLRHGVAEERHFRFDDGAGRS